ncbi:MAG: RecB family exonuclease [Ilumatobacteraceae bacterium]
MLTPPDYLSPSSINTYRECPQKFKFSRIDRVIEPPTWFTHLGTFVHEVLEHLYQVDASERPLETVRVLARQRWDESGWEAKVLDLEKPQGGIGDFKRQAFVCMENLWKVEDPTDTELMGMEHEVVADIDGVTVKGFIDRFHVDESGLIVIGDYKTGKVKDRRFNTEDEIFFQLIAYALMLQEVEQEETSRVELLYLKTGVRDSIPLTPVKLAIARGTIVETKEAVDAACAKGEFECNVTKLCDWCFHKPQCPAHQ